MEQLLPATGLLDLQLRENYEGLRPHNQLKSRSKKYVISHSLTNDGHSCCLVLREISVGCDVAVLHSFRGGADSISPQQTAAVPWNATFIRHAMERSKLARTSVLNPQLVGCLLTVVDVLGPQQGPVHR